MWAVYGLRLVPPVPNRTNPKPWAKSFQNGIDKEEYYSVTVGQELHDRLSPPFGMKAVIWGAEQAYEFRVPIGETLVGTVEAGRTLTQRARSSWGQQLMRYSVRMASRHLYVKNEHR